MAKKFTKRRLTAAQRRQAHQEFQEVLEEKQPKAGRGLRGRRAESERFAVRQFTEYQEAGGEAGTGLTWKEWLKTNWQTILAKLLEYLLPILLKGAGT